MAVEEIQEQTWVYWQVEPDPDLEPDPIPPVIHNFQHGVESLFWVILWTYLARLKDSEGHLPERIMSLLPHLFQNSSKCPTWRRHALFAPNEFWIKLRAAFTDGPQELANSFAKISIWLWRSCMERQRDFGNASSYTTAYLITHQAIKALHTHYQQHPNEYHGLRTFSSADIFPPLQ